eukprot:TRINITY_DN12130_c0_g1_i2.p1 TRINITY_DN12130_c0_g1~~TRINITY_DN12130_c0_g1_i2.p1  ORF type:complete len:563 (-),score=156.42 TRINITY_DN12130_c0_g1_i2:36-1724(-)
MNPEDSTLASKIGKALVTTHDYFRAVNYYENAVRADPSKTALFHDLIDLYLQLNQYQEAGRALTDHLRSRSHMRDTDDVKSLIADVKSYLLLAKVYQCSNAPTELQQALESAWALQKDVLAILKAHGRDADLLSKQRELAATIAYNLAQYFHVNDELDKAQTFYQEALKQSDTHEKSLVAMAKLYLSNSDLDQCQHTCQMLLRIDPAHEEASSIISDLMFRRSEFDHAIQHFKQLLERKPNHYPVLLKLIHLLRRSGRLNEAPRFFKLATKNNPRALQDPGLHYCQGLHAWYTNTPSEALKELQMARRDATWGNLALNHMIEIYLNPDNEAIFQEVAESKGDNSEHVRQAEQLMKELSQRTGIDSNRVAVLECYCQMATNQKPKIEQAVQNFNQILSTNNDYLPAILGIANAFLLLKQEPKARNQLKRVSKMNFQVEYATEFERSWLLLADIYIQVGKYDLATELCQKCLTHNKSCSKAWELLGMIMEKENSFKDAADDYEKAWKLLNEASPAVGFKLAFNYLKAKRFVEAIEVCQKVLAICPDYPKIKKDILEKARASLRP